MARAGAVSFEFLTYQLSTVGYWPTVAVTGNGELGFDSGEGPSCDDLCKWNECTVTEGNLVDIEGNTV